MYIYTIYIYVCVCACVCVCVYMYICVLYIGEISQFRAESAVLYSVALTEWFPFGIALVVLIFNEGCCGYF